MAKPTTDTTRDLPSLSLRASFSPGSVNVEARTAELVWTTGARVLRGFWERYWEELSLDAKHVRMERLNNGAPLLAAHNGHELGAVLGVVESARLEKGKGTAVVRFAKAEHDPEAERVFQKVRDGILQNISVGYRVHKLEKIEDGDDKTPVYRATDWEPYELSVVPMGADDGAGFRSGSTGAPFNPCIIVSPDKERSMPEKSEAAAAVETKKTETVLDAVRAAAEGRALEQERLAEERERATAEALKAERARVSEIQEIAQRHDLPDSLTAQLLKDGVSIHDVRKAVLDWNATRDGKTPTSSHVFIAGEDKREKGLRGMTASLLERAGYADVIEMAKQNKRVGKYFADVATDPGEFRGMSLVDLARRSLELAGDPMARKLHGEQLVKRALEFRGDQGMNTTSDYAILLETAVNKVFLGRYATIPVSWPLWCARKSVKDFRTSTFYRPGTFGRLDAVSESGEILHKNIPDGSKATLAPATKANIIGITRRAIVNDDMGVFLDLASGLGEAAASTIEYDAWAMITAASGLGANAPDGVALFNAAHGNIGSTGAMSVATLDSMRAKMALQKDGSGNAYLAVRPSLLLAPVEMAGTAKVFNDSAADPTDSKNSNVANKVKGLFPGGIVDSPYLSASSATRVYALADPNLFPVFAVGFIDGQEAPRIDSEQSFNFDGLQMKIVLDYGTAVLDYRGAVTCAGS